MDKHFINSSAFDGIANEYDHDFTHSVTGKIQRNEVYHYLSKHIGSSELEILEMNCGTGEDAKYLSTYGHKIVAFDASLSMIEIARKKNIATDITFIQCSFNDLPFQFKSRKFDLVFSNFGGLNCLSPQDLKNVFLEISKIMKEESVLIIVIMPPYYLWDYLYFGLKLNFKGFMRRKNNTSINLNGRSVPTYYYSSTSIKKLLPTELKISFSSSIGQLIPAKHLERKIHFLIRPLQYLQKITKHILPSSFSDHLYLEIKKSK